MNSNEKKIQKLLDYENNKKKNIIFTNIISILFYALSLATVLGFNDLVLTLFNSFNKWTDHIIAKTMYVIIMSCITIGTAYYLNYSFLVNR